MRKVDPNSVIDDFTAQVATARTQWKLIHDALPSSPVSLRRKVAADSFLTLAVAWESFFSDWWIGAINRDASTFMATTESKLRDEAQRSFNLQKADLAPTLVSKKHLSVQEVRRRLDPQERNLVIHGHRERQRRAQQDLAGNYRARAYAITAADWHTVECARAIRNLLAHRSASASDTVHDLLRKQSLTPALRWTGQRKLSVAGAMRYLATKRAADPDLRVSTFHTKLADLAEQLRVP
jgi:hypothetical protein